jgi:hypothetical protein
MRGCGFLAAGCEGAPHLSQASEQGYQADARYGAARVRTCQDAFERRQRPGKEVAVPEGGPRRDDQNQPGLQEVRGEQQAGRKRDDQPPVSVSTRASRSARSVTSR